MGNVTPTTLHSEKDCGCCAFDLAMYDMAAWDPVTLLHIDVSDTRYRSIFTEGRTDAIVLFREGAPTENPQG